jgi:hypothetical protein
MRWCISLLAAIAVSHQTPVRSQSLTPNKPNVVLIITDDMGYTRQLRAEDVRTPTSTVSA